MPSQLREYEPFACDPLIFGRLFKEHWSPARVSRAACLLFACLIFAAALDTNLWHPQQLSGMIRDLNALLVHGSTPGAAMGQHIPYMQDYPSLILTITITISLGLVYGILYRLSDFHSALDDND